MEDRAEKNQIEGMKNVYSTSKKVLENIYKTNDVVSNLMKIEEEKMDAFGKFIKYINDGGDIKSLMYGEDQDTLLLQYTERVQVSERYIRLVAKNIFSLWEELQEYSSIYKVYLFEDNNFALQPISKVILSMSKIWWVFKNTLEHLMHDVQSEKEILSTIQKKKFLGLRMSGEKSVDKLQTIVNRLNILQREYGGYIRKAVEDLVPLVSSLDKEVKASENLGKGALKKYTMEELGWVSKIKSSTEEAGESTSKASKKLIVEASAIGSALATFIGTGSAAEGAVAYNISKYILRQR